MRKILVGATVVLVAAAVFLAGRNSASVAGGKKAKLLSHDVYFTLKEDNAEARAELVRACKKYLDKHPGTVFFAAGTVAEDLDRDVNDRDFDVALHIVFENKAAHDQYQDAPRHLEFIKEQKDNWSKVRVFDSYVQQ